MCGVFNRSAAGCFFFPKYPTTQREMWCCLQPGDDLQSTQRINIVNILAASAVNRPHVRSFLFSKLLPCGLFFHPEANRLFLGLKLLRGIKMIQQTQVNVFELVQSLGRDEFP